MKTIIVIGEDNHGTIGYAANVYSAIKFLITESWIDENTEIDELGTTVKEYFEYFDTDWETNLPNLSLERFNEFFCDRFLLTEEDVICFF